MKKFISKVFYKMDRKLGLIMSVLFALGVAANMVSGFGLFHSMIKSAVVVFCFYAIFSFICITITYLSKYNELDPENN